MVSDKIVATFSILRRHSDETRQNSRFVIETAKDCVYLPAKFPGGHLDILYTGGGVHPIILGKKLLCYPILMGS